MLGIVNTSVSSANNHGERFVKALRLSVAMSVTHLQFVES